jgi:two-component system sensor histidine kinase/response regulator
MSDIRIKEDEMDEKSINVLLIEDNPADARLIGEILSEERSVHYNLVCATRLDEGLDRLAHEDFDAALVDLSLPDSFGIDTFNRARAHSPRMPIVVLTGLNDPAVATETLRAGGQDYLNKGISQLCVLHQTILHAIERNRAARDSQQSCEPANVADGEGQFLLMFIDQLSKTLTLRRSTLQALIDEHGDSAGLAQSLATMLRQVEWEMRLLDDVMTYATLGSQRANIRAMDCDAVVGCALSHLQPAIDECQAVITRDPLPSIEADSAQMVRLFKNLIGNAIDNRGSAAPRIHIAAERRDWKWVFSIRDHGIGLTPEDAQRAFAIFQRPRDGDERHGTGVGLAICRKIVEGHGGSIWAESELGCGSCFFFTIPVKDGEPPRAL